MEMEMEMVEGRKKERKKNVLCFAGLVYYEEIAERWI